MEIACPVCLRELDVREDGKDMIAHIAISHAGLYFHALDQKELYAPVMRWMKERSYRFLKGELDAVKETYKGVGGHL